MKSNTFSKSITDNNLSVSLYEGGNIVLNCYLLEEDECNAESEMFEEKEKALKVLKYISQYTLGKFGSISSTLNVILKITEIAGLTVKIVDFSDDNDELLSMHKVIESDSLIDSTKLPALSTCRIIRH